MFFCKQDCKDSHRISLLRQHLKLSLDVQALYHRAGKQEVYQGEKRFSRAFVLSGPSGAYYHACTFPCSLFSPSGVEHACSKPEMSQMQPCSCFPLAKPSIIFLTQINVRREKCKFTRAAVFLAAGSLGACFSPFLSITPKAGVSHVAPWENKRLRRALPREVVGSAGQDGVLAPAGKAPCSVGLGAPVPTLFPPS